MGPTILQRAPPGSIRGGSGTSPIDARQAAWEAQPCNLFTAEEAFHERPSTHRRATGARAPAAAALPERPDAAGRLRRTRALLRRRPDPLPDRLRHLRLLRRNRAARIRVAGPLRPD